jgi:AcrR family transcriptional regulator
MTRRRSTYHHGDLPRALRAAARRLVAEHGPEGFTLREAARDVGVSHAAAYRHFADKRALLAAVCEDGYRALAATLRAANRRRPTDDAATRIRRLAAAFVRFALDDPPRFHLMFGPRLNLDGRFPSLDAATDETLAAVVAEMEHGMATGRLRAARPVDLAIGFWTMVQGSADMVLRRRIKVRSRTMAMAYLERLLAPLLDGMQAPRR